MASAMLWWLASTYYPLERAPRNVQNRAPMKRDNPTLVRKRTLAARSKKPTVSGGSSIKISPVDNPGKICRVCLKDGEIPIYGTGTDLCQAVIVFGDVQIEKDDKFPKYLCSTCYSMLQSAILFRKQAKETELLLQKKIKVELSESAAKKSQAAAAAAAECEARFVSRNLLHKTESDLKEFRCRVCKLKFTSTSDYTLHRSSEQHKNALKLAHKHCSICKKAVPSSSFQQHLTLHTSNICEICGKTYSSYLSLHNHVKLHSSESPFHCEYCPYRGKTAASYRIHLRTHTGEKPYACDECGKCCTTKSNLIKHRWTHKEKQVKCNQCEKSFKCELYLQTHVKEIHLNSEEFACGVCGNKFKAMRGLRKHERKVHKRTKLAGWWRNETN